MDPTAEADTDQAMAERFSRGFEPVLKEDWVMLTIAVIDILALIARDVYGSFIPPLADRIIVGADLAIIAIFAIEFLAEMRRASSKLGYTRTHWYELVGMVPIAHWGFRMFRLVRLLRIYVVKTYPPEVRPERDWSHALVRGMIIHYRNVLLEEITDPIVLTSINVIEGPLVRARFAHTIGDTLEERRVNIQTVVEDAIRQTRGVGHILSTRYGRQLVETITDNVLENVVQTLRSEELNEVISESIQDVLNEVRERVKEKEYKLDGGGALRPNLHR